MDLTTQLMVAKDAPAPFRILSLSAESPVVAAGSTTLIMWQTTADTAICKLYAGSRLLSTEPTLSVSTPFAPG